MGHYALVVSVDKIFNFIIFIDDLVIMERPAVWVHELCCLTCILSYWSQFNYILTRKLACESLHISCCLLDSAMCYYLFNGKYMYETKLVHIYERLAWFDLEILACLELWVTCDTDIHNLFYVYHYFFLRYFHLQMWLVLFI